MSIFSAKKNIPEQKRPTQNTPQNVIVFEYLKKIDADIYKYMGICLYTSKLQNQNMNSLSRQALIETFNSVVKKDNGELFLLPNENTLIIFNKDSLDEIKSALIKMTFLFYDDPIIKDFTDIENFAFVKLYSFPQQIEELKKDVLSSINSNPQKQVVEEKDRNTKQSYIATKSVKKLRRNLSLEILTTLQKSLERMDFSSLIRRQSVCAIIGKSSPQILFDEVFVSISDLEEVLLPDVDFSSNPWLFHALTETLDKGVIANLIRREDRFLTSNFSININIETLLSDIFLKFDNNISPQMRATIVLELQLVDIFSDIKAYNLAKTFAQSRGYKICIDGITANILNYINNIALDVDFIKLIWSKELKETLSNDNAFLRHDNKQNRLKMILCRVDDEDAIKIGNNLGINLYQGRYIQKLLSQQPKKIIYDLRKQ